MTNTPSHSLSEENPPILKKSHWPISLLASLVSLINIAFPVAMTRILPIEQIGIHRIFFFYLQAIPAFSLSLGFINGLSYWGGREREGRHQIKTAGAILLLLSLTVTLLLFIFQKILGMTLGLDENITFLFILSVVPTLLNIFYETAEISTGAIWRGAIFSAIAEFLRIMSMFAVLFIYRNLEAVILAHCVLSWLKIIIGFGLARKRGLSNLWPDWTWAPRLLTYAAPISWAGVFDQFVTYPDKFILTSLISKSDFATYSVGCLAIPPLHIFEQAVNRVLIPEMSHHISKKEVTQTIQAYREAMIELMLFLIPASVGLAVFAQPIIEILFTSKFSHSAEVLRLFAFSYLMMGIPHDVGLRAQGKSYWILKTQIIFSILSLSAAFLGTYFFGIFGTLTASMMCQLGMKIYGLKSFKKNISFQWTELLPLREWITFSLTALGLGGVALGLQVFFTSSKLWFVVSGVLFTIFYFLIIHWFNRDILARSWRILFQKNKNS